MLQQLLNTRIFELALIQLFLTLVSKAGWAGLLAAYSHCRTPLAGLTAQLRLAHGTIVLIVPEKIVVEREYAALRGPQSELMVLAPCRPRVVAPAPRPRYSSTPTWQNRN